MSWITLTEKEALGRWGFPLYIDPHFTGPPHCQQPEGHGSVFHSEGQILAGLRRYQPGAWLEIGANLGISTRYLLAGQEPKVADLQPIYSVDIAHRWQPDDTPGRVVVTADSATYTTPFEVAGAFIDGDHRYMAVVKDIGTALRCGARLLVFHDSGTNHPPATANDVGSDVRAACKDHLLPSMWDVYDCQTPCGLLVAERMEY